MIKVSFKQELVPDWKDVSVGGAERHERDLEEEVGGEDDDEGEGGGEEEDDYEGGGSLLLGEK